VAARGGLISDDRNNVECMTTAISRSVSTEDRSHSPPFRTSAKIRYFKSRLTGNAAAGTVYNDAGMASLLEAVRNAGANNVVILGARSTRAT